MSQNQKGKTNLDFAGARDSEWPWHQLGHMQVCTSLQTDNHANTPPLSFLQAGCPSCRPTNSVKALKASKLSSKLHNRQKAECILQRMVETEGRQDGRGTAVACWQLAEHMMRFLKNMALALQQHSAQANNTNR